jgi:hypothetical protein
MGHGEGPRDFLPMDADITRNIPFSTRRQNDFWKGIFTVHSVYRMLVQTKERQTAWLEESSAASNVKEQENSLSSL